MFLDIKTATVIYAILSLLMGILMWAFRGKTVGLRGPGFWALHYFTLFFAQITILVFNSLDQIIFLVLANFTNAISTSLLVTGIWAFKGKKIRWQLLAGYSIAMLLTSAVFVYVFPNVMIRKICFSIILILILSHGLFEFIKPASANMRLAYRINSYLMGLFIVVLACRAVLVIFESNTDIFASTFVNNFIYLVLFIIQPGIAFGLMLMVNFQMAETLGKVVKTKNLIFSILAHDVRSPMASIIQFVDLLSENPTEEQRTRVYSSLKKLTESVFSLMENLLEWTRSQSEGLDFKPETIFLHAVIEDVRTLVEPSAAKKQIHIYSKIDPSISVYADNRMILTVMRNLLMNAVKFSHTGGEIRIEVREDKEFAEISIKDHGTGISEANLAQLFCLSKIKPGKGTAGESGTGLGLIICRDFVEWNSGKLTIESKEGEGTTVRVSLPVH